MSAQPRRESLTMRACAIGKFDALHLGHRALVEHARGCGEPTLVTFSGMAEILGWPQRPPLLAVGDRSRVLAQWHACEVSVPFSDVRTMSPAAFLQRLVELGAGTVIVGEDFRFGHNRAAGIAELPSLAAAAGLRWSIVPALHIEGSPVSSSRVRQALELGDVALVARLLGRPYRLCGTVVRGDGRGRHLGFPTANCGLLTNQPPTAGVYAAHAWIGDRGPWPTAVNAGLLPTMAGQRAFRVEAHMIGFSGDAYDRPIAIELHQRLRDEQKFLDVSALVAQIAIDVANAAAVIAKRG